MIFLQKNHDLLVYHMVCNTVQQTLDTNKSSYCNKIQIFPTKIHENGINFCPLLSIGEFHQIINMHSRSLYQLKKSMKMEKSIIYVLLIPRVYELVKHHIHDKSIIEMYRKPWIRIIIKKK